MLVTVREQGPGINAEDQKKLFQKFTRLTARPTGGEGSTGLGLSIVKRLVDAMGGNIQCQSTPGDGAVFIVRLPIGTKIEVPKTNVLPMKPGQLVTTTETLTSAIRN